MPAPRRLTAVLIGGAVALTPALLTAVPAEAATASVALVGDLQSEVGCPGDWDPACTATALTKTGPSTYARTFTVPAGSWEIKVAVNGSTDEAYGAGGAKGGANIPLVLKGPAAVSFSYDDSTHQIGMTPTTLCSPRPGGAPT